jgi:hypothetical protein
VAALLQAQKIGALGHRRAHDFNDLLMQSSAIACSKVGSKGSERVSLKRAYANGSSPVTPAQASGMQRPLGSRAAGDGSCDYR